MSACLVKCGNSSTTGCQNDVWVMPGDGPKYCETCDGFQPLPGQMPQEMIPQEYQITHMQSPPEHMQASTVMGNVGSPSAIPQGPNPNNDMHYSVLEQLTFQLQGNGILIADTNYMNGLLKECNYDVSLAVWTFFDRKQHGVVPDNAFEEVRGITRKLHDTEQENDRLSKNRKLLHIDKLDFLDELDELVGEINLDDAEEMDQDAAPNKKFKASAVVLLTANNVGKFKGFCIGKRGANAIALAGAYDGAAITVRSICPYKKNRSGRDYCDRYKVDPTHKCRFMIQCVARNKAKAYIVAKKLQTAALRHRFGGTLDPADPDITIEEIDDPDVTHGDDADDGQDPWLDTGSSSSSQPPRR